MFKVSYILSLVVLLGTLFNGCKKAPDYDHKLYFTGTELSPDMRVTIDGPENIGISVTSSAKLNQDMNITLAIQPEMVEAYNKRNGTTYQFLPAGSYSFSTTGVVIHNGFNISDAVNLSITSLDNFEEGVVYCVPVSITEVEGGMPVLESSKTTFIIINRTIITQAIALPTNRYFTVPSFLTATELSAVANVTMECRVFVNAFQTSNPFIASVMGLEEVFLLRFGDVSIGNNQLQLAGGQVVGAGKYPVTSSTFFSTGQWYHIAAVYNGSTIALYVNGVLDNYTDATSGGINLTNDWADGFHIGRSAGGRGLNGRISEARVWSRALTATELRNNLCYVDPQSNGLIAYWRFNGEIDGNNVPDLTGNGHTAVGNNSMSWVDGVRCPD